MATTTVSDAVVVPQAKGTGLGSEDDNVDAAAASLLAEFNGQGEYVGSGMTFSGHDGTNDQVDVTAGYCFIEDESTSTGGSRGSGGNPQVQSTSSSGYDTEIPNNQFYLVIFPTDVTNIDVSDSTLNEVWVNITDVTSNNAVEVRTSGGGGTTSAPSDTFIKLGEANPDDSSADFRAGFDNQPDAAGWRLDPNSPHQRDPPASSNAALSLAGRYEEVKIEGAIWTDRAQDTGIDLRVNGDSTSNYRTYLNGSTERTGLSEWNTAVRVNASQNDTDGGIAGYFGFIISGRWPASTNNTPTITTLHATMNQTGGAIDSFDSGYHTGSIASPLTDINIVPSNNVGFDINIYGRRNVRPNV